MIVLRDPCAGQVMGATGGEVFGGNKSAVVNFLGFSKVGQRARLAS